MYVEGKTREGRNEGGESEAGREARTPERRTFTTERKAKKKKKSFRKRRLERIGHKDLQQWQSLVKMHSHTHLHTLNIRVFSFTFYNLPTSILKYIFSLRSSNGSENRTERLSSFYK